jgi:Trypsin
LIDRSVPGGAVFREVLFKIQRATSNSPIVLSTGVRYYDDDRAQTPSDKRFTTLGFGKATPNGGVASKDLLSVVLRPIRSNNAKDCENWVARSNRSADGVSCAYTFPSWIDASSPSDYCQASAGAPVVDYFGGLLGVTSWDDGCTRTRELWDLGTSLAYSSVVDFGPWLREAICSLSDSSTYCQPQITGGWSDGTSCVLGSTCNKCTNPATHWTSKATTACGKEQCWPRRTLCGAGTTCNKCCNGYSWKLEDFFTSCN